MINKDKLVGIRHAIRTDLSKAGMHLDIPIYDYFFGMQFGCIGFNILGFFLNLLFIYFKTFF